MFRLYKKTVDQYYGGQLYLNADFFQRRILHAMRDRICLIRAKRGGTVIAQTFNLVSDGVFYGRYWGCEEEEVEDLHFETCCCFQYKLPSSVAGSVSSSVPVGGISGAEAFCRRLHLRPPDLRRGLEPSCRASSGA